MTTVDTSQRAGWEPTDDMPAISVFLDEAPNPPNGAARQRTAVIDGTCTNNPNPHLVSMLGAGTGVLIGVSGLVYTALTNPGLVMWPIGATLAATVATAVNALRHDLWQARQ